MNVRKPNYSAFRLLQRIVFIWFPAFLTTHSYSQNEIYGFKQLNDSLRIDALGDYIPVFSFTVYSNDSTSRMIHCDTSANKIYAGNKKNNIKTGLWIEYSPSTTYLNKKMVGVDEMRENTKNLTVSAIYYFINDTVMFSLEKGLQNKYSHHTDGSELVLGTWKDGIVNLTFQHIGTQLYFDKKNRLRTITYSFKVKNRSTDIEVIISLDEKNKIISVIDKTP